MLHTNPASKHPSTCRIVLSLLLGALVLEACSGSESGGRNDEEDMADTSRDGDGPADADTAQLKLAMCQVSEPCAESSSQLVENTSRNIRAGAALCLLESLAALKAGRYEHVTDSTFSNGSIGARHTLIATGDGSVLYARVPYADLSGSSSGEGPPPEPVQRCTLRPPSYFEACRAAVEASNGGDTLAWECTFGDGDVTTPSRLPWFESCAIESPTVCE